MNRTYGYVRVSSKEQNEERQVKALLENGVEQQYIFIDKQSGKDTNRPQYQILRNALRSGDTVIIKSLDRFSRSYKDIIEEYSYITKQVGANLVILDLPLLDTRQNDDLLKHFINDLVLQILGFVSETERKYIKQRQKEGIEIAKSKGTKFGRKRIEKPSNWNEVISKWKNGEMTGVQTYRELGLKETTFYRLLREEKKGK